MQINVIFAVWLEETQASGFVVANVLTNPNKAFVIGCTGGVLLQQWDEVETAAVCDWHITGAYERICWAVRQ